MISPNVRIYNLKILTKEEEREKYASFNFIRKAALAYIWNIINVCIYRASYSLCERNARSLNTVFV